MSRCHPNCLEWRKEHTSLRANAWCSRTSSGSHEPSCARIDDTSARDNVKINSKAESNKKTDRRARKNRTEFASGGGLLRHVCVVGKRLLNNRLVQSERLELALDVRLGHAATTMKSHSALKAEEWDG